MESINNESSKSQERTNEDVSEEEMATQDIDTLPSSSSTSASSMSEIDEIEIKILEIKQDLRAKKNQSRTYFRISAFFGLVFVATLIRASQTEGNVLWFLSVVFAIVAVMMLIASLGARLNEEKASAEIELLEARKRILSRLVIPANEKSETVTSSYFERLVRINVENLAEYYTLIKVHTNNSFRISAISGVVGFLLIIIGLVVGFVSDSQTQYLAFIVTGSGVLIEFVSGIFFYLYNRTIRELKGYHDSLLVVQNILLSFKIIEEISDDQQKTTMIGKMLEFLMTNQIGKNTMTSTKPAESQS